MKKLHCRLCGQYWGVSKHVPDRGYTCPCCTDKINYRQYAGVDIAEIQYANNARKKFPCKHPNAQINLDILI